MFQTRTHLFRISLPWFAVILLGFFLSGCTAVSPAQPVPEAPPETAQKVVITSITPLADLIKQVAGDKVEVINLIPAGSDPHDYEPMPNEVRKISQASLYFANGLGLEHKLSPLIANAANPHLRTVVLSEGLPLLGTEQGGQGNPHLWLDVQNAQHYVEKVRDALVQTYPADADFFARNADQYLTELTQLDQWIKTQIALIPPDNRKFIVFHDAWPYYAQRYGLKSVHPIVHTGEAEPLPQDYAQLIQVIRTEKIKAIFSEAGFNPKLTQQLAAETGVKLVENLYDGTLGDTPETNSYIGMMKFDTKAIAAALK